MYYVGQKLAVGRVAFKVFARHVACARVAGVIAQSEDGKFYVLSTEIISAGCPDAAEAATEAQLAYGIYNMSVPSDHNLPSSPVAYLAEKFDKTWSNFAAAACGNGRHGYPEDWPGSAAKDLLATMASKLESAGLLHLRDDIIAEMRYGRFLAP